MGHSVASADSRPGSLPVPESILSALAGHVDSQGDQVAYTFLRSDDDRQKVTYRELDARARGIARELLRQAEPGDRALLTYPPGLEFIEAFLGCLYAGVVAVPAYPPKKNRNADRVLAMARDCTPRLLLCTSETRGSLHGEFAASVGQAEILATDQIDASPGGGLPEIASDRLAFLQYTSGSTAAPRGVMVSHGNIVANERLIQKYFEFSRESVMVSWLPMFHDMGLIGGILAPLFVGFPSILMAPNLFLLDPVKWLRAITEFRGTVTGAPNFAYDLCVKKVTEQHRRGLELSSLKIAYNGAEPVRAETLDRFSAAFAGCGFRKEAFFPCYGMAETTLLVSGGPPLSANPIVTLDPTALEEHRLADSSDGKRIVSCGQVTSDLEVRIVNPDTSVPCREEAVGEIWVSGLSVAQGYLNRPTETAATFHATISGDDRRWLRTGDYGFLRGDQLYVTGRLKDLIIIRGRNIYPQDVERIAEQYLPGASPNSAAAFSVCVNDEEQMALVLEASRSLVRESRTDFSAERVCHLIEEIRAAVAQQLDIRVEYFGFLDPLQFPRTSSGKLQRRVCKLALLKGSLSFLSLPGSVTSLAID